MESLFPDFKTIEKCATEVREQYIQDLGSDKWRHDTMLHSCAKHFKGFAKCSVRLVGPGAVPTVYCTDALGKEHRF